MAAPAEWGVHRRGALLAAILIAVVVQPDLVEFTPSPSARRLYAWGALALMVGCGYGAVT